MSEAQPFFRVQDYRKFGELISRWAKQREANPDILPKDFDNFIAVLEAEGIGPLVPGGFGKPPMKYHFLENDRMNVSIPTKEMIDAAENAIGKQSGGYVFPVTYDRAYEGETLKDPIDPDIRKDIQKARLADYCISICM